MTTTVSSTIGSTGTYSTLQSWEDAAPANLVTSDQVWEGQCQNQNFTTAGSTLLTMTGSTSDATHYKHLTTATGASFRDHATAASNPLKYDATKGAAISGHGAYSLLINASESFCRISKLQISGDNSGQNRGCISVTSNDVTVRDCILETSSTNAALCIGSGNASLRQTLINVVCIQRVSSTVCEFYQSPTMINCTVLIPSDVATTTKLLQINYPSGQVLFNCAFFGGTYIAANTINNPTTTTGYTTCYSDMASPPTGVTQVSYNTTTGSGFEGTTAAAIDARIKSTSALKDTGTTDSTNAATDIIGQARTAGTYDVGAWEYTSAAAAAASNPARRAFPFAILRH